MTKFNKKKTFCTKYDYYSPTRAYAMQNILDAIVFGAIWPYPTVVIIVMVNSMELAKLIQFFINRFRKMQLVKVYIKVLRFYSVFFQRL